MNATSSRAHTVVTITFDQIIKNADSGQETKKSSVMNLVDLAGTEASYMNSQMFKAKLWKKIQQWLLAISPISTNISKCQVL